MTSNSGGGGRPPLYETLHCNTNGYHARQISLWNYIHVYVTFVRLGLDVLGIFRRTPSNALVHQIKGRFDAGETVVFKMIVISPEPLSVH